MQKNNKNFGQLGSVYFCESDRKWGITAREYVMLLRIILFMDEIVERGLSIICKTFWDVGGKGIKRS